MIELKRTACVVLPLVLKGKWFDMIERGGKREEYRDRSKWHKRMSKRMHTFSKGKDHLVVAFQRGYTKPAMWFEVDSVCLENAIGHHAHPEWGEPNEPHFVLKLGARVELTDSESAEAHSK